MIYAWVLVLISTGRGSPLVAIPMESYESCRVAGQRAVTELHWVRFVCLDQRTRPKP